MLTLSDPGVALHLVNAAAIDSTWFSRVALNFNPWSKQTAILRAVRRHRRVIIQSGHGVGKSRILAAIALEWMATKPGAKIVCTAGTNAQIHDVLWSEVRKLYRSSRIPIGGEMQERGWKGPRPDWFAVCKSVDDPTALQGVHGEAVLIIVDEAEGVAREMWEALDTLLSSEGARMVAAFNPTTPSGYCFEATQRPDLWHTIAISCLEHPNFISGENVIPGAVTRAWVEECRASWGEDDPRWAFRVLGQFPKTGTRQLASIADLDATIGGGTAAPEPPRAGLDVARFGGDRNVLCLLDDRRRVVACDHWTGHDAMQTVGRVVDRLRGTAFQLRVDTCGMGGPFVDRFRELGVAVDAVDFGAAPSSHGGRSPDWALARGVPFRGAGGRKDELHYVLRQLVRDRAIEIGPKFCELRADLAALQYEFDSAGHFRVDDKETVRVRIGRSPDFSDALVIALSNGFSSPEDYYPR